MEGTERLASRARYTLAEVLQITISFLTSLWPGQVFIADNLGTCIKFGSFLLPILWASTSKNTVVAKQALNPCGSSDSLSATEEAF